MGTMSQTSRSSRNWAPKRVGPSRWIASREYERLGDRQCRRRYFGLETHPDTTVRVETTQISEPSPLYVPGVNVNRERDGQTIGRNEERRPV